MTTNSVLGSNTLESSFNDTEADYFFIKSILREYNTALPCKILKADNTKFRFDVQPLLNYLDTNSRAIPAPILYNIPLCCTVGGTAGIIVEPQVGDVVLVVFIQRDWENLKRLLLEQQTGQSVNPNTSRVMKLQDGLIVAMIKSQNPPIYVKVVADKIELHRGQSTVTLNDSGITLKQGSISEVQLTNSNILAKVGATQVDLTSSSIIATTTTATINATTVNITGTGSVNLVSSGVVNTTAPAINMAGVVTITGSLNVVGVSTLNGIVFGTHVHLKGGGSVTEPPQNP